MTDFTIVLKNSRFLNLWVSQILSQTTINIMNFLLLTYLYSTTHSSIATSFLWISFSLPALLVGPIGAASVDLVDRRKMLMITNLLQAVTIVLFIFVYPKSVFFLYVIVFLYSTLNQFYMPAESAMLPSVVSKKALSRANSLFFMTMQAAIVFGFGIAGFLQRTIGLNGALVLSAGFLMAAFVSVSFLPPGRPGKVISGEFEKDLTTFFQTILDGYKFIRGNKTILFPLLILLFIQAGLAMVIVSLPTIASEVLNIPLQYSGVSIVVPAGIGALMGSIYVPRLIKSVLRKKTMIELSLGIISFTLLALSLGIPLLPITLRVSITSLLIILTGFAFVGISIPALTFLQENTPEWFRGRVFGNLWFMVTLVTIIPVLFSGAINELFGVRTLLAIMAFITLIMLFYSAKKGQEVIEEHFVI